MKMALPSRKTRLVSDESLENWEPIGSGGFGDVYRASHTDWGFDVAIKMPHNGVCFKEAILMDTVSFEFVLRVYGIYQRCSSVKRGIVMEFMRRGSVESLLSDLSGPPPWPLAFRLAHQVAAGMNFLHAESLVHQDLKPSNVLLTEDLDARLADFGLSRVSTSALTSSSSEQTGEKGGTYKYMPPEAFDASYEPVRDFDIYSYGILLWSIVSGKEPYRKNLAKSHLESEVKEGTRPRCEDLEKMEVEGLKELVVLMKRCWDADPDKRPKFYDETKPNDSEVLKEIEDFFLKHEKDIDDAVYQVKKRLASPNGNQCSETSVSNCPPPQAPGRSFSPPVSGSECSMSIDEVDMQSPITDHPSTQDACRSSARHMTDEEKEKFVDDHKDKLIQRVKLVVKIAEKLGKTVDGEIYANIRAAKTPQGQMRVLYESVLDSEGKKVKVAFYEALKINHPHLVEDLGGS